MILRRYNPNSKNRDEIAVPRTIDQRQNTSCKQLYLLYRIRWNIELLNKAAESGKKLRALNQAKRTSFLYLSYCHYWFRL